MQHSKLITFPLLLRLMRASTRSLLRALPSSHSRSAACRTFLAMFLTDVGSLSM